MVERTARTVCMFALVGALSAQDPVHVRGRVVDEDGAPLAGVAVGVPPADGFFDTELARKDAAVRSGEDGRFVCEFDRRRSVSILLMAPNRQSLLVSATPWGVEGDFDVGTIVLVPGAQLIGRVRDERGEPLAGARIRITSSIADLSYNGTQALMAGACSDAKGIFRVPGVPRSALRAEIQADGYRPVSRLVAQESPLDVTLQRADFVRGRVVDADGKPIAGASVSCVTAERLRMPLRTKAGADGTFELATPGVPRFLLEAYEGTAPRRRFRSELLHGAAADVVLRPLGTDSGVGPLEVTVVDAATKARVPAFRLATTPTNAQNPQLVFANAWRSLRAYEGEAVVDRRASRQVESILVLAAGHGFAIAAVPETEARLVVELGPEAVLRGRVTDAATGKPMAGVAVRALPKGNSGGSGGDPKDFGPLTDADGRYTLSGLVPGDYTVQAHAPGRPASPPIEKTLVLGGDNRADLVAPAELWVELEFPGDQPLPPGCTLRRGSRRSKGQGTGFFQHSLGSQLPREVVARRARVGPLEPGEHQILLFVPSRVRAGTGTTIELGWFDPTQGPHRAALPELRGKVLRGTVDLAAGIPSERVAVLAWPAVPGGRGQLNWNRGNANAVGIDGAGRFTLDVPGGSYCLQLADLATGIVFHMEAEDVTAGDREIAVRPDVHWLDLRLVPEHAGTPVVVGNLALRIAGLRDGTYCPFLRMSGATTREAQTVYNGNVEWCVDDVVSRWLVPAGQLGLEVQHGFDMLRPTAISSRPETVASESLTIDSFEHAVTLRIPAPPTDEELLR